MCIKEKFNNKTTSKFQSYKIIILSRPFPLENKQFDTFKFNSNCNTDVIERVEGGGKERKKVRKNKFSNVFVLHVFTLENFLFLNA